MKLRANNIKKLGQLEFDVAIVGGGINGAVSAAALSARGARVALIDRGDFGGATSQESSNLVWGGIKYLESFEFALVRKLCLSRNNLIESYPSTVKEIRFYTTHERGFRHSLIKLYLGSWFYWLIGSCFTKTPRWLSKRTIAEEESIINPDRCSGGLEYSDAYLHDNDARFVFNFIRSALTHGCIAANYVESVKAEQDESGSWRICARDVIDGDEFTIRARSLVNSCGPSVDNHNQMSGQTTEHHHVFSKGIHLIVNQVTKAKRVLTFFADDGRLFFAVPMGPKTCIGTTDTRVDNPETYVSNQDRQFVLDNINARLRFPKPLGVDDIIAERCGVRPLVTTRRTSDETDWMQLSRKHHVDVNVESRHISIFGGKLTDCLNVGEEVCAALTGKLGLELRFPDRLWYGEPAEAIRDDFFHQAELMNLDGLTSPESSEVLSSRLWRRYGAQGIGMLENIREDPAMAEVLIKGTEYIRAEIRQAARREMITRLDDFLRRRSKIALIANTEAIQKSPGLMEACRMLFGNEAQVRFDEYFAEEERKKRRGHAEPGGAEYLKTGV